MSQGSVLSLSSLEIEAKELRTKLSVIQVALDLATNHLQVLEVKLKDMTPRATVSFSFDDDGDDGAS